jgi:hypothetical protein
MGVGDITKFYNFVGKDGLSGGLNVTDHPVIVPPSQMVEAKNIAITQTLSRKKRPGKVDYNIEDNLGITTSPIRGIIQYQRFSLTSGDALTDIVFHQDAKIWRTPDRTSAAVDITGALVLDPDSYPRYQVFEGVLYFVSSKVADGFNKWDGATVPYPVAAVAANPPPDGPGTLLGTWAGRLIMAGVPDFPFRFYISAPLDGDEWVANGENFDLTYDGESGGITAIFPETDGLLFIATKRSLYQLSCTDPNDVATFRLERVTRGVGCVGQGTVVATPNDVLFCSARGLHSLRKVIVSDQSEITFLSRDVQKLFTNMLNTQLLSRAQAQWDEKDNIYALTVASVAQSTADVVLAYNITFDLWLAWDGINARSLNYVELNDRNYILAGGEDGKISYLDGDMSTDLNEGFACSFKSGKFFPGADITHEFSYVSVTVLITADKLSDVQIAWTIDSKDGTKEGSVPITLGDSSSLLGSTFVLGVSTLGIGRFIPLRVSVQDVGYNFQLQITASGESSLEFHGWVLEVDDANTNYTA